MPLKAFDFFSLPLSRSHLRRRLQTDTNGTPTNAAMHASGATFAVFIIKHLALCPDTFNTRLDLQTRAYKRRHVTRKAVPGIFDDTATPVSCAEKRSTTDNRVRRMKDRYEEVSVPLQYARQLSGIGDWRNLSVTVTMCLIITLVILVIMDLDSPRRGFIRSSQQSMVDLQNNIK